MIKLLQSILLLITLTCSPMLFAGQVNINTADAAQLAENLKGIGPVKAKAIVKYRKEVGSFKTIDDLVNVSGIGKKTLEKNRGNILLSGGAKVSDQSKSE